MAHLWHIDADLMVMADLNGTDADADDATADADPMVKHVLGCG